MPLSEHEERILAEIQRQLEREDPAFVSRTRRTGAVAIRRWWAVLGVLAGVALLLAVTFSVALALVGFVVLLVSVTTLVRSARDLAASRGSRTGAERR